MTNYAIIFRLATSLKDYTIVNLKNFTNYAILFRLVNSLKDYTFVNFQMISNYAIVFCLTTSLKASTRLWIYVSLLYKFQLYTLTVCNYILLKFFIEGLYVIVNFIKLINYAIVFLLVTLLKYYVIVNFKRFNNYSIVFPLFISMKDSTRLWIF